ncbi:MAG: ribosome recycling factor [Deltaproteobacteria bacterium]|nr:ribosome recycling factor [Deltaproteobacteria bacterium]RLA88003.1 MAG: ribosome recycling factor [Deltaproteobacteria bacterium]
MEALLKEYDQKMEKTLKSLEKELSKIRTGRANLSLFDDIKVEYYGTPTPLKQLATMAIPETRLITIQPWDTNIIGEIEKAILKSDLGVTPANDGKVIRITLPRLTEERRKDLVKIVKKKGENSKVSIRNIRREANEKIKSMEKKKEISQDDMKRMQEKIQELTDSKIEKIDKILAEKEKEIMEIS